MMSVQRVFSSICIGMVGLWACSPAEAQLPDIIYTWDHGFGEDVDAGTSGHQDGPSTELWDYNFGGNTLALDNTVDGTLHVVETGATAGADWAIGESYNRVKEIFNGADLGALDLTGLSSFQLDIGHNGPNAVGGQMFAQVGLGPTFVALGGFSVVPGPVQTYDVSLANLAANQISSLRQLGIQIFDHAADGNLEWTINELRSAGTPANRRLIADHNGGAADFDGVITNFEETSVNGHMGGKNNSGLTINTTDGALQWVESAGATGVALEWGNNNNQFVAEDFVARPMDLRNYPAVEVRIRAQSTVPGETIGVQYYMQNEGFTYYSAPDQSIPADAQYHTLRFPLGSIPNRDQVNIHGVNFHGHEGTVQFRVDFVEYVPEPASALMLLTGCLAGAFCRMRSRS